MNNKQTHTAMKNSPKFNIQILSAGSFELLAAYDNVTREQAVKIITRSAKRENPNSGLAEEWAANDYLNNLMFFGGLGVNRLEGTRDYRIEYAR